ncbi:MAG: rhodanese-like domain-containing protein, partial [Cytophagaceae bacterium]
IDTVLSRGTQPLTPDAFEAAANETGALVLDVRAAQVFANGFIPNSINIGLSGQFAPWVGALIPDVRQELLLVCEPGQEQETLTRLARVGYDQVLGYLQGGFSAWEASDKEVDRVTSISADTLANLIDGGGVTVIDVRKPGEFTAEHIDGAKSIPLDFISEQMAEFPKDETMYIHCAGGYRSMMAASILKARGYNNVIDVAGGFAAIKATGRVKTTDYVCPSTLANS